MDQIKLKINGNQVVGKKGQTILDIARENGIDIPTMCHDERVETYGSCGVCTVEVEGNPRLFRSCSTLAAEGMSVSTDTPRIRQNRKLALELLLSDHVGDCRAPCSLACPAQTDCQGYVGFIADGEYEQAYNLIMDKTPMPASLGRVCPHPCEEACRRRLVEEPISIAALKRFAGDTALNGDFDKTAQIQETTGKKIAVVGGGPGGLTAAYFLRLKGHDVTVYDSMPYMGGMLRYGIPEYRLPKKVLQQEIDYIEKTGVQFRNNVQVGKDITIDGLRSEYDAVILAVGAWSSMGLRCPGEELKGVTGGISFLLDVAVGNIRTTDDPFICECCDKEIKPGTVSGLKIAVVGGGNTAMDVCRTAVRLGAAEVYNIYRRTKNEMPAEEIEITEAEEEGVVFKNLTNPIEIIGDNGKVKAIRLQIMELGEPDASGRRAPVPIEGKEELIEVDMVIAAIGQKPNLYGIDSLETTKWGTIAADEHTFRTSIEGVFAIGDATNNGADIVVSAMGEAKRAAEMVDKYLFGEELSYTPLFLCKTEKIADDFEDIGKSPRARISCRSAKERSGDFIEVADVLTEEQAQKEAARCLKCGCHDYFECKLIKYANQYGVQPEKYEGKVHNYNYKDNHPYIRRNPDKCILCGLCVRVCDEVNGAAYLGLVGRGFDAMMNPEPEFLLHSDHCLSCGFLCVGSCPTGALEEIKIM